MLKPDLSDGATKFGAHGARHRGGIARHVKEQPLKVSMPRIPINSQGYDSGGAYWGVGDPLYWAGSGDGIVDVWFRASSRKAAKAYVRQRFPHAKFYR